MSRLWFLCVLLLTQFTEAKEVKRIVALSPHSVEMLFAIGAGDKIVGTVEYADFPEAALEIPRIGNYSGVQVERVVELQPDLIVAWKSGNKLADLKKLESLGFEMFFTHPLSISEVGEDIIRLGEKVGHLEQAKKVATEMSQQHTAIKQKYANKRAVKIFYQLWHDPLKTVSRDSWVESLIKDCHGENIFAEVNVPYPVVSMESVLVKNPEVVIAPHHSGPADAKRKIWDNWQNIDAVKHQRIYVVSGDTMLRSGPRATEGLTELCELIDSAR